MSGRIVAFSGIRDIDPDEAERVRDVVCREAELAVELRFGGARGLDTMALRAATALQVRRVVYVPFRVDDQPYDARMAIGQCATEVIELGLPRQNASYMRRNDRMIDGADRLVAFTDGRRTGGTSYAISMGNRAGVSTGIYQVRATGRS